MKPGELRPKRPIKGDITAVMIEYIGEANEWEWWDIVFGMTPKEAVELYHEAIEQECEKITMNGDKAISEDAQAYYITF